MMSRSSTDDDSLLSRPCASLSRLVYVVEAEHILGCEFVVVDRVLWKQKIMSFDPNYGNNNND